MAFFVLWKGHLSECPHLFGCNWASKGQDRCAVFRNVNLLCDTVPQLTSGYTWEQNAFLGQLKVFLLSLDRKIFHNFFILLTFHTWDAVASQQSGESLLWETCQDAVCLAGTAQHFKNLDRWGAISWEVTFCWASKALRVEGGALYPVDIPVLLLACVTANEKMMAQKEKKKKKKG